MKTQSGKVRVRPKDPKGLRTLLQSGIGFVISRCTPKRKKHFS